MYCRYCMNTFVHICICCLFVCIHVSLALCSHSGSDGLVKLWTIKTNECVKTLDIHQDKVWGLHTSSKDNLMVTGAADSNIIVWKVRVVSLNFLIRLKLR